MALYKRWLKRSPNPVSFGFNDRKGDEVAARSAMTCTLMLEHAVAFGLPLITIPCNECTGSRQTSHKKGSSGKIHYIVSLH
jgi:hypothetical protein